MTLLTFAVFGRIIQTSTRFPFNCHQQRARLMDKQHYRKQNSNGSSRGRW
ncbi:hypothetical protein [Streptomyces synnematoformans]